MTKTQQMFHREVRALGVFVGTVTSVNDQIVPYVDDRDASPAQQKVIAKIAKRLGLKIEVSDKGASFE